MQSRKQLNLVQCLCGNNFSFFRKPYEVRITRIRITNKICESTYAYFHCLTSSLYRCHIESWRCSTVDYGDTCNVLYRTYPCRHTVLSERVPWYLVRDLKQDCRSKNYFALSVKTRCFPSDVRFMNIIKVSVHQYRMVNRWLWLGNRNF